MQAKMRPDWFGRLGAFIADVPKISTREQRRFVIVGRAAMPMGLLFHSVLGLLFLWLGATPLFWFNVASVALWGAATWRLYHLGDRPDLDIRWPFVAGAIVEVPLHAVLATWYLGLEAGFTLYIFAAVATVPLTPFLTPRKKLLISAVMTVVFAGANYYAYRFGAAAPFDFAVTLAFLTGNSVITVFITWLVIFVHGMTAVRMEEELAREQDRSEALLLNILPADIAAQLKDAPEVIAEEHADATILFADIVGFTEASATMRPAELVGRLNRVFSAFDDLAERHGVEKIKTIGDAYMVVAGLPRPRPDHAAAMIELARDMLAAVDRINQTIDGPPIRIRIGVNSGPVIAGVIGQSKFAYDLWGDAVNVAARMEQAGAPGEVRITEATRVRIGDAFGCADRGLTEVKGKGAMRTFTVETG